MKYICVDCGCTNMRARLFDNGVKIDESRRKAGGRNTAFTGSNEFLKASLKDCLAELLEKTGTAENDVEIVLLSGTITSNVGVYHAHHTVAPAGVPESAKGARRVVLPEISSMPMLFIPGVRVNPDGNEPDRMTVIDHFDSMSGEECEAYGIMELTGLTGDFSITLPGSYNKAFYIDKSGRISTMSTGMCGEFMTALSEHTLMGLTLPKPVIRRVIPDALIEGFDYASRRGVSAALAKSRIAAVNAGYSDDETGNFFAGASLHGDISSAYDEYIPGKKLVIGGSNPFRTAFEVLLRHKGVAGEDLYVITDEMNEAASPRGQMAVYKEYLRLTKQTGAADEETASHVKEN